MLYTKSVIKKLILALAIIMIAISIFGCSSNGNEAYLGLYDKVAKKWKGPSEFRAALDPKALETEVNNMYGKKDINYSGIGLLIQKVMTSGSNASAIDEWIDEASAIWDIRNKGLRESRNYLLLALKSVSLPWAEYDQLVYRQMMSDEKLPSDYVKQRIQEIVSLGSTSQDAYEKAGQPVEEYKKKHKS